MERSYPARRDLPVDGDPGELASLLRCLRCDRPLSLKRPAKHELPTALKCATCGASYPVTDGTARMLGDERAGASAANGHAALVQRRTAQSFAYEWRHFGQPRAHWRQNFLGYLQPHQPEWFAGKRVLDVGTGSGRHSSQAHELGASVVAVDVGEA
ncbi:MAG TPA: hypothetical protein VHE14_07705, partial [Solirubrobacteraceae bacterium]|nr:hypothetical protein [Solirubrobacteraceae bacterium]